MSERIASIERNTNETKLKLTINLDGDNADGIDGEVEVIQYFDGGSAAGI